VATTAHRASALAIENGAVPIDVSLRKSIIEAFVRVQCNGEMASDTSYLIGTGPQLPIYSAWMAAYSTAEAKFTYFESTSLQAKQQLQSYDEHFGTTGDGLEEMWYAAINDVALTPVIIYALGPGVCTLLSISITHTSRSGLTRTAVFLGNAGYNVPELEGLELVLD
jgi:hypothetical protein